MIGQSVTVTIEGEEKEVLTGTVYEELAQLYQMNYEEDIVLVKENNKLAELTAKVQDGAKIEFITTKDTVGRKVYRRSVTLLMQEALHHICKHKNFTVHVLHSIGQGYYCEIDGDIVIDAEFILKLKIEMMRMVDEEIPILKKVMPTDEAVKLFHDLGMYDKEKLFSYRRSSTVNVYDLDGYKDYYFGYMAPNTSYLKYFDLLVYEDGFVLQFPNKNPKVVEAFNPSNKLFHVLQESAKWGKMLGIENIGSLNDEIARGKAVDMVLVQEALMEKKIGELAEEIAAKDNIKFVMIAGPSSSGKTTFSHRLSIQMMAKGLKPHPIPLDDYYLNREFTPKDENGEFDFECLEAIDVELFNKNMMELMEGKTVELPTFNFKTGKREYGRGRFLTLKKGDILVIEGIHGLNDKLSYMLPKESKYKIYISPLTQLNIDEHNPLPTTDGRLIRRIVRDARTRNTSAKETISMWASVRRGEEKNIFPFQEQADAMFNSALIYELAVLKPYAEPLLAAIDKDSKEYVEAKRLLKFLDYVLPISGNVIANNSILREFIGDSIFHV